MKKLSKKITASAVMMMIAVDQKKVRQINIHLMTLEESIGKMRTLLEGSTTKKKK